MQGRRRPNSAKPTARTAIFLLYFFFLTRGTHAKDLFYFADLFDTFLTVFGVNAGVFATKEKDKERDDASEI